MREQAVRHLLHRELSMAFSSWHGASEVAERERVQHAAAVRMARGSRRCLLSWRVFVGRALTCKMAQPRSRGCRAWHSR